MNGTTTVVNYTWKAGLTTEQNREDKSAHGAVTTGRWVCIEQCCSQPQMHVYTRAVKCQKRAIAQDQAHDGQAYEMKGMRRCWVSSKAKSRPRKFDPPADLKLKVIHLPRLGACLLPMVPLSRPEMHCASDFIPSMVSSLPNHEERFWGCARSIGKAICPKQWAKLLLKAVRA